MSGTPAHTDEARRWLVIANASAGSTDRATLVEVVEHLDRAELVLTSNEDELTEVLAGLAGRTPAIAGGDGSIHATVRALDRLGILADQPVALLPMGTGNDLARGVGLALDPVEVARGLRSARVRTMAAWRWSGGLVVNDLHVGAGADAARRADRWGKRLGALTYPLAAAVELVAPRPLAGELTVDTRRIDGPVAAVFVAVGPTIGGGFTVADTEPHRPDARVVVVPHLTGWRRLRAAARATRGGVRAVEQVESLRADRCVVIRAGDGATLAVDVDGELVTGVDEVVLTAGDTWQLLEPVP